MKKLMFMFAVAAAALVTQAECRWCWWVGGDSAYEKIDGCQLGLASECREVTGAQVSLIWGRVEKAVGCQFAIGYTNCGKLQNGPQLGIVNIAREGAALQFGLLNFNKSGFLPCFPFFNFAKTCFGAVK